MQRTLIVIFLLLCGFTLLSLIGTLLSAPETRLVLSRFDPTLSEPIPEEPTVAPRNIEPGLYQVKSGEVTFMIAHPTERNNVYTGTTTLSTGALMLTESKFKEWNGSSTLAVDMASINFMHEDSAFDLHSADFFATEAYPQALLTIHTLHRRGDSAVFDLTGRLTLRGETHDVTLPSATMYVQNDTLVLETDFTFDRTQWGMTHASPSFSGTQGYAVLNDNVTITLTATFPLNVP